MARCSRFSSSRSSLWTRTLNRTASAATCSASRWRRDGHALVLEDLDEVLDDLPQHLVIGTGADGRMQPDRHTVQRLKARGMTVESLPTGQAVRRYAELQPARTAAALHLTC